MTFFIGLHQPLDAKHLTRCFISINRLRHRKSGFEVGDWILDSGAFTGPATHGRYRYDPEVYAAQITRWATSGRLLAASTQDYMCEPFMAQRTGLDVATHQRLTIIGRYDHPWATVPARNHIMPVLQGYRPRRTSTTCTSTAND